MCTLLVLYFIMMWKLGQEEVHNEDIFCLLFPAWSKTKNKSISTFNSVLMPELHWVLNFSGRRQRKESLSSDKHYVTSWRAILLEIFDSFHGISSISKAEWQRKQRQRKWCSDSTCLLHSWNADVISECECLQTEPSGTTENTLCVTSSLVHKWSGAVAWRNWKLQVTAESVISREATLRQIRGF